MPKNLITDIQQHLRLFNAINAKPVTINKTLKKKNIRNVHQFASHYEYKNVYNKFAQDYLEEIFN